MDNMPLGKYVDFFSKAHVFNGFAGDATHE